MGYYSSRFLQISRERFYTYRVPLPPTVLYLLKTSVILRLSMEPTLEEKVIAESTVREKMQTGVKEVIPFLEHEIECPRCHDSMLLCSDFDNLYYACQECDFCLYTIKKN